MINLNNDTIENLIKIIKPENTLTLNNLSLFQKNQAERISFLQKKRKIFLIIVNYLILAH